MLHLSNIHALIGGDEGESRRLELRCEERGEDGGGAGVVGGEAAVVGLRHVLLGTGYGVKCLQSIRCPPQ